MAMAGRRARALYIYNYIYHGCFNALKLLTKRHVINRHSAPSQRIATVHPRLNTFTLRYSSVRNGLRMQSASGHVGLARTTLHFRPSPVQIASGMLELHSLEESCRCLVSKG